MKKYFQNLKEHPGTEYAGLITVAVIIMMYTRHYHSWMCIPTGLLVASPFWLTVLITNYTNNK